MNIDPKDLLTWAGSLVAIVAGYFTLKAKVSQQDVALSDAKTLAKETRVELLAEVAKCRADWHAEVSRGSTTDDGLRRIIVDGFDGMNTRLSEIATAQAITKTQVETNTGEIALLRKGHHALANHLARSTPVARAPDSE